MSNGLIVPVWSSEDYDWIEFLAAQGLPLGRIAALMAPPVSASALRYAIRDAGLDPPVRTPGRPDGNEARAFALIELEVQPYREEYICSKITRYAKVLGYDVTMTKRPPE